MGLNEKEKLVLARVWKTVNNTSKPTLGFDDIVNDLDMNYEEVRFICDELEQKGWLKTSGSDICYDPECRRKYTEFQFGPIPKDKKVGCSNCFGKQYTVLESKGEYEYRQCSYCGGRYRVESINGIERRI